MFQLNFTLWLLQIFLWSCYTGLRFSDVQSLKEEDIIIDTEGKYWLHIDQKKTNAEVNISLVDKAVELYHRYEQERVITGKVLPQYVNQKVNPYGLAMPRSNYLAAMAV